MWLPRRTFHCNNQVLCTTLFRRKPTNVSREEDSKLIINGMLVCLFRPSHKPRCQTASCLRRLRPMTRAPVKLSASRKRIVSPKILNISANFPVRNNPATLSQHVALFPDQVQYLFLDTRAGVTLGFGSRPCLKKHGSAASCTTERFVALPW